MTSLHAVETEVSRVRRILIGLVERISPGTADTSAAITVVRESLEELGRLSQSTYSETGLSPHTRANYSVPQLKLAVLPEQLVVLAQDCIAIGYVTETYDILVALRHRLALLI